MKKTAFVLILLPLLMLFGACGRTYDYTAHLSEVRRDIFRAETEAFTLTLSCIEREHPYASDGVTCPISRSMEVVLVPADRGDASYRVFLAGDAAWGGEMSKRNIEDDWYYSESIEVFPETSVSLSVERNGETTEISATSVKNEDTMSAEEALKIAVEHEKEAIKRMTADGAFQGEFRVRLLRREVNYYYVGIVSKDGKTISLLLGAESGEVLARREAS